MYCGICVEVCPFDALHWSPFFEYTSYSYEGMIHEPDVLTGWQEHVLPPPPARRGRRREGATARAGCARQARRRHWGVIREADKKDAFLAAQAAGAVAERVVGSRRRLRRPWRRAGTRRTGTGRGRSAAPQRRRPTPATPRPPKQHRPPPAAPAADLGGVPRIDPNNLPDGISPVERGRLKKLAMLQQRGEAPTADLVENLRPTSWTRCADG